MKCMSLNIKTKDPVVVRVGDREALNLFLQGKAKFVNKSLWKRNGRQYISDHIRNILFKAP